MVKLAWTGDVVQETYAENDPQSNVQMSSKNMSDKIGSGVSFECRIC